MTYDPRQSFKAQQAAYSRAAGTQTSKQQGISQGRGTPDYSSSAYDSGGYDEIKLPSAGKVDQKIKTGLGSPSSGTDKKDDRNLDQKIYDGMKYYGAKFLGLDKPDPRADDMFLLEVYGGDDMFVIPEPTPMTINYLDDDGDYLGSYDFIDMSKLGNDPRQPRTQPNIDTAPQIGGYDEAPVLTQPKGLMSPPDPEVPDVNIDDDEMARIAGQTTAPKSEPNTYTVTAGDTLSEIARDYGKTVEELVKINNIKDKDKILVGQKIKLEADFDDPTEATAAGASEAAAVFSDTTNAIYNDFVNDKQEGDKPHVGQDNKNITLAGGIVADGLKYDGKDFTQGVNVVTNFDPSKLDTSGASKTVGGKTIKRSNYTSDEQFSKAVIKAFEDEAIKQAGTNWAEMDEGAKKAVVKIGWNKGADWYKGKSAKAIYNELAKEDPEAANLYSKILTGSTVKDGGASIGIAKARANAWNETIDATDGAEITKIVTDNTGSYTKFEYYDSSGNLLHTEETDRVPSIYENKGTTVIEKNSAGQW